MKVLKFNSTTRLVTVNVNKYKINWDKDGASKLEVKFRDFIKKYWINNIVLFQCRIPGSLLRIDFLNANKRLAVEVNGSQHEKYNAFFSGGSRTNYLASIKRDLSKEKWLEQNNIKLIVLNEDDLDKLSRDYILEKFDIDIL